VLFPGRANQVVSVASSCVESARTITPTVLAGTGASMTSQPAKKPRTAVTARTLGKKSRRSEEVAMRKKVFENEELPALTAATRALSR
jgi:hypothetical protein